MSLHVRWTVRASEQLADAAAYLEEARTGYGEVFLDDVEALAEKVRTAPSQFPRVPVPGAELRRALVRRFGYWVVFEVGSSSVDILALWYGRREPEGWRGD